MKVTEKNDDCWMSRKGKTVCVARNRKSVKGRLKKTVVKVVVVVVMC